MVEMVATTGSAPVAAQVPARPLRAVRARMVEEVVVVVRTMPRPAIREAWAAPAALKRFGLTTLVGRTTATTMDRAEVAVEAAQAPQARSAMVVVRVPMVRVVAEVAMPTVRAQSQAALAGKVSSSSDIFQPRRKPSASC